MEDYIREFEQLQMRVGLDEESELKSYMDEKSLKPLIQMDSTLVTYFKETMEVQVQV